jgi:hypothetical protein
MHIIIKFFIFLFHLLISVLSIRIRHTLDEMVIMSI